MLRAFPLCIGGLQPHQMIECVDHLRRQVVAGRPALVALMEQRGAGRSIGDEIDELVDRKPFRPNVVPGVSGGREITPDGTPMLLEGVAEPGYSDSSIPANSAQARSILV
jgi:hypothetical protein